MLIELIEHLRRWESHTMCCQQCRDYDDKRGGEPCGIGQAIILNLLKTLEKGL